MLSIMEPAKSILLLDDHPIMLEAIKLYVLEVLPNAAIQTACRVSDAIACAQGHDFDFAILDLTLPDLSGLSVLRAFKEAVPDVPVIICSATYDRKTVISALDAGAMGFIPKNALRDVLLNALRLVFSGSHYVPPEALAGRPPPKASKPGIDLTPRQQEIMELLMKKGQSNKRIGQLLDISENTVKVHVSAVLRALNAENRTQAVLNAVQLGIRISPADDIVKLG